MSETRMYEENALKVMAIKMQEALAQAAEPLIQQALRDIEKKMRERVAIAAMAILEHGYSVHTRGSILEITVRLDAINGSAAP